MGTARPTPSSFCCPGSKQSLSSSLGRCSQISRGAALGPLAPLSRAWIYHQCAEHSQFQIKAEGVEGFSTLIHQAYWNCRYMQWSICEHEWNMSEKIKAVSPLSLKSNRFTVFECLSLTFPRFFSSNCIVSRSNTNRNFSFYSTLHPKSPKCSTVTCVNESHSYTTNIQ